MQTQFLKNVGIMGGLLMIAAHGAGKWSVDEGQAPALVILRQLRFNPVVSVMAISRQQSPGPQETHFSIAFTIIQRPSRFSMMRYQPEPHNPPQLFFM